MNKHPGTFLSLVHSVFSAVNSPCVDEEVGHIRGRQSGNKICDLLRLTFEMSQPRTLLPPPPHTPSKAGAELMITEPPFVLAMLRKDVK